MACRCVEPRDVFQSQMSEDSGVGTKVKERVKQNSRSTTRQMTKDGRASAQSCGPWGPAEDPARRKWPVASHALGTLCFF